MKVSTSSKYDVSMSNKKPLLTLVPITALEELSKENSTTFSLHTDVADNDSPTYKVNVRILQGDEELRALLRWKRTVLQIIEGLGINAVGAKMQVLETMMRGTPVTLFRSSMTSQGNAALDAAVLAVPADGGEVAARAALMVAGIVPHRTNAHFEHAINEIITNLAPKKALQRVKRYLRRECRKPADMKVRTYYQHVLRVNMEEIPQLPPFAANQGLGADEILDILLYGTPRSWQREMDRQGFDPMTKTILEVVDFLEQVETSEDFDGSPVKSNNKTSSKKKSPSTQGKTSDQKHCSIHGWGGHSSEECYKLHPDAKRQKSGGSYKKGSGKYSNNSWSRKGSEGSNQSKKELAHFVQKAVADGIKQHVANDKKRKGNKPEMDLNAFDADLKDFNYQDMDDLKIETDDEVSV